MRASRTSGWVKDDPIIWLARSPDLNVLDYFVWSHIKNLVEHRRDGAEAEIRKAILADFNTITPVMTYCTILLEGSNSVYENEKALRTIFKK